MTDFLSYRAARRREWNLLRTVLALLAVALLAWAGVRMAGDSARDEEAEMLLKSHIAGHRVQASDFRRSCDVAANDYSQAVPVGRLAFLSAAPDRLGLPARVTCRYIEDGRAQLDFTIKVSCARPASCVERLTEPKRA